MKKRENLDSLFRAARTETAPKDVWPRIERSAGSGRRALSAGLLAAAAGFVVYAGLAAVARSALSDEPSQIDRGVHSALRSLHAVSPFESAPEQQLVRRVRNVEERK